MRRIVALLAVLLLAPNLGWAQSTEQSDPPNLRAAGFLQTQFVADQTGDASTYFSIYRARLGVTGTLTERISINLVGGGLEPPAQTPRLVNAFADIDLHPAFRVRAGQFLVPFGLEGPEPIPLKPTIERAVSTRRLNDFTMFRDIGVQVRGTGEGAGYALALINGSGANTVDSGGEMDVLGRVHVSPVEDLDIGLSGHYGSRSPQGRPSEELRVLRWGLDADYDRGPIHLRGEYIGRQDERLGDDDRVQRGGYLFGGYRISGAWEPVVRVDAYDPNSAASDDLFTGLTIGGNYYFDGQTRVSVNYEIRDDEAAPEVGNRFWVQMQLVL